MHSYRQEPRTNYDQFIALVEFMEKNGDLSSPRNLPQGYRGSIKKWEELTDLLNSMGSHKSSGRPRSEVKWRKVWTDLKAHTKRKWIRMKRADGGPGLTFRPTDLEKRVMSIMGIPIPVERPLAEGNIDLAEKSTEVGNTSSASGELQTDDIIIIQVPEMPVVGDENWNTHGSSNDTGPESPVLGSRSLPNSNATPKSTSPPMSPIVSHNETFPQTPLQPQLQRTLSEILEEYANKCDTNMRYNRRDDELSFQQLERDRIRQRDTELRQRDSEIRQRDTELRQRDTELRQRDTELRQRDSELQLQAQWLDFMKAGLNMLDRYLNRK